MSTHFKVVPLWARGVTFLVGLANAAFGVMGYFNAGLLFKTLPPESGLTLDHPVLVQASHEFSARNLAIGVCLLLVAAVGVPETIAIMMMTRALVEMQSIGLALANSGGIADLAMPGVFLITEILVIVTMFKIVRQRDKTA